MARCPQIGQRATQRCRGRSRGGAMYPGLQAKIRPHQPAFIMDKSGARRGYDASMAEVLQPVDDAQLIEFAYYLARLR